MSRARDAAPSLDGVGATDFRSGMKRGLSFDLEKLRAAIAFVIAALVSNWGSRIRT